jgi:transmembrane sensor
MIYKVNDKIYFIPDVYFCRSYRSCIYRGKGKPLQNMNKKEAKALFDKYVAGNCSPDEKLLFESLYVKIAGLESDEDTYDLKSVRDKIYSRLPGPGREVRLWPRIAVAAAVALIVLGVYFFNYRNGEILKQVQDDVVVNDIAPGKNTATLTLANGKTINLSDTKTGVVVGEELKYNDGTDLNGRHPELVSGSPPLQLTASTPRGGTYIITLPDGTKVWLNADSKLEFPSKFGKNEQRIVRLSGEGYFEVTKNKRMPFIVISKGQEVEVLGTHFNINAYGDEVAVKTTLLEGSVKVSSFLASPSSRREERSLGHANSRDSSIPRNDVVLKPNQQSVLSGSNRIAVKEVDPEVAVAWKEGLFIFDDEALEGIMRKLALWYDVEVVYGNENLKQRIYGGSVSRFGNVSTVLRMLEKAGDVHFRVEGKKIFVSK